MKNPFVLMALAVTAARAKFAESARINMVRAGTHADPARYYHRSTNKFQPGQSGTGTSECARRVRQMARKAVQS